MLTRKKQTKKTSLNKKSFGIFGRIFYRLTGNLISFFKSKIKAASRIKTKPLRGDMFKQKMAARRLFWRLQRFVRLAVIFIYEEIKNVLNSAKKFVLQRSREIKKEFKERRTNHKTLILKARYAGIKIPFWRKIKFSLSTLLVLQLADLIAIAATGLAVFLLIYIVAPSFLGLRAAPQEWKQTTIADFSSGTLTDAVVTGYNGGGVELEQAFKRLKKDKRVNDVIFTNTDQINPVVAVLQNNGIPSRFVVAWEDYLSGSRADIYVRFYDTSGNPIGESFKVNDEASANYKNPAIASDNNGYFVIAWTRDDSLEGTKKIYYQMFDPWGYRIGGNAVADPSGGTNQDKAAVVMRDQNDLFFAWQEASGSGIYYTYSGAGQSFRADSAFSTTASPALALDEGSGNIILAWQDDREGIGQEQKIYFQRFDSNNNLFGKNISFPACSSFCDPPAISSIGNDKFVIATSEQNNQPSAKIFDYQTQNFFGFEISSSGGLPTVAGIQDTGDFAISLHNAGNLVTLKFNSSGQFITSFSFGTIASNIPPKIDFSDNGDRGMAVFGIWGANGYDVFGQRFNLNLENINVGNNFLINDGSQYILSFSESDAAIAEDPETEIKMAVWIDDRNGHDGIFAQLIGPDGTLIGANYNIFPNLNNHQIRNPSVGLRYDQPNNKILAIVIWETYQNNKWVINSYGCSFNEDGSGWVLSGLQFIDDGQNAGNQSNSSVAISGDKALVVWQDDRNEANYDVYAQLVEAAGHQQAQIGSAFMVNSDGAGNTQELGENAVGADSQRNFYIAWLDSRNSGGANKSVYARRYNAVSQDFMRFNGGVDNDEIQVYDGSASGAMDVAIATQNGGDDDGASVIVWLIGTEIKGRWYDSINNNNQDLGEQSVLSGYLFSSVSAAANNQDGFLVGGKYDSWGMGTYFIFQRFTSLNLQEGVPFGTGDGGGVDDIAISGDANSGYAMIKNKSNDLYYDWRGNGYADTGTYESPVLDSAIADPYWWTITSRSQTSNETSVKFQIATSDNSGGPWVYLGPNGDQNAYYTGTEIWSGNNGNQYLRYKAYLETEDPAQTPILESVTISYASYPLGQGWLALGGQNILPYSAGGKIAPIIKLDNNFNPPIPYIAFSDSSYKVKITKFDRNLSQWVSLAGSDGFSEVECFWDGARNNFFDFDLISGGTQVVFCKNLSGEATFYRIDSGIPTSANISGWAGEEFAVTVDSQGIIHLATARVEAGQKVIRYSRYQNGQWENASGAPGWDQFTPSPGQNFIKPEIALDSAGNPAIVFEAVDQASGGHAVGIVRWNGSVWENIEYLTNFETGGANEKRNPVVASSNQINLAVAYGQQSGGNDFVYYQQWNGGTWAKADGNPGHDEFGKTFGGGDYKISLAIRGGNPYLVWENKFNFWDGSMWKNWAGSNEVTQNMPPASSFAMGSSLALDNNSVPYLALEAQVASYDEISDLMNFPREILVKYAGIDLSPPATPALGGFSVTDSTWQNIKFSIPNAQTMDPESGIDSLDIYIHDQPGMQGNLLKHKQVTLQGATYSFSPDPLGQTYWPDGTYYVSVKATNGSGFTTTKEGDGNTAFTVSNTALKSSQEDATGAKSKGYPQARLSGGGRKILRTADGALHMVYSSRRELGEASIIFYTKSQDNGANWTMASNFGSAINKAVTSYGPPSIKADNLGNLYIGYLTSNGYGVRKSTDNGDSWNNEVLLDTGYSGVGGVYGADFAVSNDGSKIGLVWSRIDSNPPLKLGIFDANLGGAPLYSENVVQTWLDSQGGAPGSEQFKTYNGAIISDDNNNFIFAYILDNQYSNAGPYDGIIIGGRTILGNVYLQDSAVSSGVEVGAISLAQDSVGRPRLLYQKDDAKEIFYKECQNFILPFCNWSISELLATPNQDIDPFVQLAVDPSSDINYLAWTDATESSGSEKFEDVFVASGVFGNWGSYKNISQGAGFRNHSRYPSLVEKAGVVAGTVDLIWTENNSRPYQIYPMNVFDVPDVAINLLDGNNFFLNRDVYDFEISITPQITDLTEWTLDIVQEDTALVVRRYRDDAPPAGIINGFISWYGENSGTSGNEYGPFAPLGNYIFKLTAVNQAGGAATYMAGPISLVFDRKSGRGEEPGILGTRKLIYSGDVPLAVWLSRREDGERLLMFSNFDNSFYDRSLVDVGPVTGLDEASLPSIAGIGGGKAWFGWRNNQGEIFITRAENISGIPMFETPRGLGGGYIAAGPVSIASKSSSAVYAAWAGSYDTGQGVEEGIFVAKFNASIDQWETPEIIWSGQGRDPQIVLDGNSNLHVVWIGAGGDLGVWYSRKEGGSWSQPETLYSGAGGSEIRGTPSVASSINYQKIYAVWEAEVNPGMGDFEIFLSKIYYDQGQGLWVREDGNAAILSDPNIIGPVANPQISVKEDDSKIFLAFNDEALVPYGILWKVFDGANWSNARALSNNSDGFSDRSPSVVSNFSSPLGVIWNHQGGDSLWELVQAELDVTPPSRINNLSITNVGGTTVDLWWTEACDDIGVTGREARFSTSGEINDSNWDQAMIVPGTIPAYMGCNQPASFTATNLPQDQDIWFAIRSRDMQGNWSLVSNSPYAHTLYIGFPPEAPLLFSPPDGAGNVSLNPDFRLSTTDAENQEVFYEIKIYASSYPSDDWKVYSQGYDPVGWNSGLRGRSKYQSGQTAIFQLGSTFSGSWDALKPNTQYYWQARAIDPSGSGLWGNWSNVYSFRTGPAEQANPEYFATFDYSGQQAVINPETAVFNNLIGDKIYLSSENNTSIAKIIINPQDGTLSFGGATSYGQTSKSMVFYPKANVLYVGGANSNPGQLLEVVLDDNGELRSGYSFNTGHSSPIDGLTLLDYRGDSDQDKDADDINADKELYFSGSISNLVCVQKIAPDGSFQNFQGCTSNIGARSFNGAYNSENDAVYFGAQGNKIGGFFGDLWNYNFAFSQFGFGDIRDLIYNPTDNRLYLKNIGGGSTSISSFNIWQNNGSFVDEFPAVNSPYISGRSWDDKGRGLALDLYHRLLFAADPVNSNIYVFGLDNAGHLLYQETLTNPDYQGYFNKLIISPLHQKLYAIGQNSNVISIYNLAATLPQPPNPVTDLAAVPGIGNQAILSWSPATDPDGSVVSYDIYTVSQGNYNFLASGAASNLCQPEIRELFSDNFNSNDPLIDNWVVSEDGQNEAYVEKSNGQLHIYTNGSQAPPNRFGVDSNATFPPNSPLEIVSYFDISGSQGGISNIPVLVIGFHEQGGQDFVDVMMYAKASLSPGSDYVWGVVGDGPFADNFSGNSGRGWFKISRNPGGNTTYYYSSNGANWSQIYQAPSQSANNPLTLRIVGMVMGNPATVDFWIDNARVLGETIICSYEDNTWVQGTERSYAVKAIDNDGLESDWSNIATITITNQPPTTISDLLALPYPIPKATLTWSASSDPDGNVLRYEIYNLEEQEIFGEDFNKKWWAPRQNTFPQVVNLDGKLRFYYNVSDPSLASIQLLGANAAVGDGPWSAEYYLDMSGTSVPPGGYAFSAFGIINDQGPLVVVLVFYDEDGKYFLFDGQNFIELGNNPNVLKLNVFDNGSFVISWGANPALQAPPGTVPLFFGEDVYYAVVVQGPEGAVVDVKFDDLIIKSGDPGNPGNQTTIFEDDFSEIPLELPAWHYTSADDFSLLWDGGKARFYKEEVQPDDNFGSYISNQPADLSETLVFEADIDASASLAAGILCVGPEQFANGVCAVVDSIQSKVFTVVNGSFGPETQTSSFSGRMRITLDPGGVAEFYWNGDFIGSSLWSAPAEPWYYVIAATGEEGEELNITFDNISAEQVSFNLIAKPFSWLVCSGNSCSFRDVSRPLGKEMCYLIRAQDNQGAFSDWSNTSCAVIGAPIPPSRITDLVAIPRDVGEAELSWTKPSDVDGQVQDFNIYSTTSDDIYQNNFDDASSLDDWEVINADPPNGVEPKIENGKLVFEFTAPQNNLVLSSNDPIGEVGDKIVVVDGEFDVTNTPQPSIDMSFGVLGVLDPSAPGQGVAAAIGKSAAGNFYYYAVVNGNIVSARPLVGGAGRIKIIIMPDESVYFWWDDGSGWLEIANVSGAAISSGWKYYISQGAPSGEDVFIAFDNFSAIKRTLELLSPPSPISVSSACAGGACAYTDESLDDVEPRCYKVAGRDNDANEAELSNLACVLSGHNPPPSGISDLRATIGPVPNTNLSWSPAQDQNGTVDSYKVFASTGNEIFEDNFSENWTQLFGPIPSISNGKLVYTEEQNFGIASKAPLDASSGFMIEADVDFTGTMPAGVWETTISFGLASYSQGLTAAMFGVDYDSNGNYSILDNFPPDPTSPGRVRIRVLDDGSFEIWWKPLGGIWAQIVSAPAGSIGLPWPGDAFFAIFLNVNQASVINLNLDDFDIWQNGNLIFSDDFSSASFGFENWIKGSVQGYQPFLSDGKARFATANVDTDEFGNTARFLFKNGEIGELLNPLEISSEVEINPNLTSLPSAGNFNGAIIGIGDPATISGDFSGVLAFVGFAGDSNAYFIARGNQTVFSTERVSATAGTIKIDISPDGDIYFLWDEGSGFRLMGIAENIDLGSTWRQFIGAVGEFGGSIDLRFDNFYSNKHRPYELLKQKAALDVCPGASCAFTDTSGVEWGLRCYRVLAVDNQGREGPYSNIACSMPRNLPPNAVTDLSAQSDPYNSPNINLSWTPSQDPFGNVVAFDIYLTEPQELLLEAGVLASNLGCTSGTCRFTDNQGISGEERCYRVVAIDDNLPIPAKSEMSNEACAIAGYNAPPTTIDDLAATSTAGSVNNNLFWTPAIDPTPGGSVSSYNIYTKTLQEIFGDDFDDQFTFEGNWIQNQTTPASEVSQIVQENGALHIFGQNIPAADPPPVMIPSSFSSANGQNNFELEFDMDIRDSYSDPASLVLPASTVFMIGNSGSIAAFGLIKTTQELKNSMGLNYDYVGQFSWLQGPLIPEFFPQVPPELAEELNDGVARIKLRYFPNDFVHGLVYINKTSSWLDINDLGLGPSNPTNAQTNISVLLTQSTLYAGQPPGPIYSDPDMKLNYLKLEDTSVSEIIYEDDFEGPDPYGFVTNGDWDVTQLPDFVQAELVLPDGRLSVLGRGESEEKTLQSSETIDITSPFDLEVKGLDLSRVGASSDSVGFGVVVGPSMNPGASFAAVVLGNNPSSQEAGYLFGNINSAGPISGNYTGPIDDINVKISYAGGDSADLIINDDTIGSFDLSGMPAGDYYLWLFTFGEPENSIYDIRVDGVALSQIDWGLLENISAPVFCGANNCNYTDDQSQIGEERCYKVSAIDDLGAEAELSNEACVITGYNEPPTAVSDLEVIPLVAPEMQLRWSPSVDPTPGGSVAFYNIYVNPAGGGYQPLELGVPVSGLNCASGVCSYIDSQGIDGEQRCYRLEVIDNLGAASELSNEACATVGMNTPPSKVLNLSAVPGTGASIDLSWASSTDPNGSVKNYRVYHKGWRTVFEDDFEQSLNWEPTGAGSDIPYNLDFGRLRFFTPSMPLDFGGQTTLTVSGPNDLAEALSIEAEIDAENSQPSRFSLASGWLGFGSSDGSELVLAGLIKDDLGNYYISSLVNNSFGPAVRLDSGSGRIKILSLPSDSKIKIWWDGGSGYELVSERNLPLISTPLNYFVLAKGFDLDDKIEIYFDNVRAESLDYVYVLAEPQDTAWSDFSGTPGEERCYKVSAVDNLDAEGEKSDSACATVPEITGNLPPSDITDLAATPGMPLTINLGWSPVTDPDGIVESYDIYYYNAGNYNLLDTILVTSNCGPASCNYLDGGLTGGSEYCYAVKAVDDQGEESVNYSNIACATASSETPRGGAPQITPTVLPPSTPVILGYSDPGKTFVLDQTSYYNIASPYFEFSSTTDSSSAIAGFSTWFGKTSQDPGETLNNSSGNFLAEITETDTANYFMNVRAVDITGNWSPNFGSFSYHYAKVKKLSFGGFPNTAFRAGEDSGSINIQTFSEENYPVRLGAGIDLEVSSTSPTMLISKGRQGGANVSLVMSIGAGESSSASFSFSDTKAGGFIIRAKETPDQGWEDALLSGEILPGIADPSHSSIAATPPVAFADRTSEITVAVTVADRFDNLIKGHLISFISSSASSRISGSPAATDSLGSARVRITASTGHKAEITALDLHDGVEIGKVAIEFLSMEEIIEEKPAEEEKKEELEEKIEELLEKLPEVQFPGAVGAGSLLAAPELSLSSIDFVGNYTIRTRPLFVGHTFPDAKISIFIQSDLIVGSVKADASGDFSFRPALDLDFGEHFAWAYAETADGFLTATSPKLRFVVVRSAEEIPTAGVIVPPFIPPALAPVVQSLIQVGQKVEAFRTNPVTQLVTKLAVVPAAGIGAAVSIWLLISQIAARISDILPLFNYLFSTILETLGIRRRRKPWGIVYNSVTKEPIDLAIVRVFDEKTNRLIETRVTDSYGRFGFLLDSGCYFITVTKNEFHFPSQALAGLTNDGKYECLYFGKPFHIKADEAASYNIPLDPEKAKAKIKFIDVLKSILDKISAPILYIGIGFSLFSIFIAPKMIASWLILGLYLALLITKRILLGKRPKPWGVVFDEVTRKPIPNAVIRIYGVKYKNLLETRVSDSRGRFGFVLPKGEYYIEVLAPGYKMLTSRPPSKRALYIKDEVISITDPQKPALFDVPLSTS